MLQRRIGPWQKKMTEEAKRYAVEQLACNVTSVQVAKNVKEKFDIQISDVRIRTIRDSKLWYPIFRAARIKFEAATMDETQISIAGQKHRLKAADKMAKKLERIVDRIDEKIESLTESNTPWDSSTEKCVASLTKTLRETAKTYREFLQYAHTEPKQENKASKGGNASFLTQINIEQTKEEPKVIDVDTSET